jgi:hypothetical protein
MADNTPSTPAASTTAAASTATPAAATSKPDAGIVAIDSNEHKEAKATFTTLKDKLDALGVDLKDELKKIGTLLHL